MASLWRIEALVELKEGKSVPLRNDAPCMFHYSWEQFDELMRKRHGSYDSVTTYCCKFLHVPQEAAGLRRYTYHFKGPVGFRTMIQNIEKVLVGTRRHITTRSDLLAPPCLRFAMGNTVLKEDVLLRAKGSCTMGET